VGTKNKDKFGICVNDYVHLVNANFFVLGMELNIRLAHVKNCLCYSLGITET
jgi:hypothetical protein